MGQSVTEPRPSSLSTILLIHTILTFTHGFASPNPGPASNGPSHLPLVNMPNPRIIEGPKDSYVAKDAPATFNCDAQGDPKPNISWYHNDRKLIFNSDAFNENLRILLPTGQLFFLQMLNTKDKSYAGKYYCEATNKHGTAKSDEAVIEIAVIKDDFKEEPTDTSLAIGSTATLHCRPPRGAPEPQISWTHNNTKVQMDGRISIQDGNLVIKNVRKEDNGEYVCKAQNLAGEKKTLPVLLNVLEIPKFEQLPGDTTVKEGSSALFRCVAKGDGDIKITWERVGGVLNKHKWTILANNTLRIDNVDVMDIGTYVCTAQNEVGTDEAAAHLSVEFLPTITPQPKSQTIAVGRTINLRCQAKGNPEPTIYWDSSNSENLMFENNFYANGRISVLDDGTLRIVDVQPSDEGDYTCMAYSSTGEDKLKIQLTVTATSDVIIPENDLRPPPVIRFGPTNQTLPPDSVAMMLCQVMGQTDPVIQWYWEGKRLKMTDPRFTQLDSGTLQISSLKPSDAGVYMCKASSETGETTMEATLRVDSQVSYEDAQKALPDLVKFPGAPEKPVVSDVTDSSVRLTWELLRVSPTSRIIGYQVEYFQYGSNKSWQVAGNRYLDTDIIIGGLEPDTTYIFMVRARNEFGIGGPSPASTLIRTLSAGENQPILPVLNMPAYEREDRLEHIQVMLDEVKAVNSTVISVSWTIPDEYDIVTGFQLNYKKVLNMGQHSTLRYGIMMTQQVPYRPLNSMITGLKGHEYYEICVRAMSGVLRSACSPPMIIQSRESVPSGPPVNVNVQRESDSSVIVSWSPPDVRYDNSDIIAYQVKCLSIDEQHNCSTRTNGSTLSVKLENLVPGINYNIEVAAQTKMGTGKWSNAYSLGPGASDITKEPWFIALIAAVGGLLWLGLCVFTVWLCRSRKRRKKLKEQWFTGGQTNTEKQQDRNGSIARHGYGKKDGQFVDTGDQGQEFSTLLQQSQHEDEAMDPMCGQPELKTFCQSSGPVTPYATTALLQAQAQANRMQGIDPMFRQALQHSGGSGDSNTDRSNTTDENGFLLKQNRKAGYRPIVPQNPGAINWNDHLPPPPIHLPSDENCHHDDQLYSEIPDDQARSLKSPASACSCPVPPTQHNQPYNSAVYSDNCNRCQSLRNFDNRPYSPQQLLQLRQGYPPNAHTLGPMGGVNGQRMRGGTPVYLGGYSQPWDNQPLPRVPGEYDYAQVPRSDGYSYSQPIQDALIQHSNTHGGRGVITDMCDGQGQFIGQNCHPLNIPGGPPGNYCEGPFRSQVEALNSVNNCYHRNVGENLPYMENYKIDSGGSGNEYRVCNSGGSHAGSGGESGRSNVGYKGRLSMEGSEFKGPHIHGGSGVNCRQNIYPLRGDGGPAGQGIIDEGYTRNADSPISDEHDLTEDDNNSQRDSMVANWESMDDGGDVHSSSNNEAEDDAAQFMNEQDFLQAVATAAERSGLVVNGTTVTDPNTKGKKIRRHRPMRPPSPGYSTDSNYGTADIPKKPYPKSQRRKQMTDQAKNRKKGDNSDDSLRITETSLCDNVDQAKGLDVAYVQNPSSSPAHFSSPPIPSLYRNKPTEGAPDSSTNTIPVFKFSDDIPVV